MILLMPIGEVERGALEALSSALADTFGQRVRLEDGMELTGLSWDRRRNQYLSSTILAGMPVPSASGDRVLGVVDVDIFARGLNFVFGEADPTGRKALISLKRLRTEFYGLRKDEQFFRERAIKEAVHELGHTYGLNHCPDPACVMHFSNSLRDTDSKGCSFCSVCRRKVD